VADGDALVVVATQEAHTVGVTHAVSPGILVKNFNVGTAKIRIYVLGLGPRAQDVSRAVDAQELPTGVEIPVLRSAGLTMTL
jgi:hypothetical protein